MNKQTWGSPVKLATPGKVFPLRYAGASNLGARTASKIIATVTCIDFQK